MTSNRPGLRGTPFGNLTTADGLVIQPKAHAVHNRLPGADRLSSIGGQTYMRMSIADAVKHTGSRALSDTYYNKLQPWDWCANRRDPHSTYDVYVPVNYRKP